MCYLKQTKISSLDLCILKVYSISKKYHHRTCIVKAGRLVAGPTQNVKLHNDLMLKLHKILNKNRLPELKMSSEMMLKKYWSNPTYDNAMLFSGY